MLFMYCIARDCIFCSYYCPSESRVTLIKLTSEGFSNGSSMVDKPVFFPGTYSGRLDWLLMVICNSTLEGLRTMPKLLLQMFVLYLPDVLALKPRYYFMDQSAPSLHSSCFFSYFWISLLYWFSVGFEESLHLFSCPPHKLLSVHGSL